MHFVMFYEFVDDYLQRRAEFRNEHLQAAWESQQRGELVLGGAYADPADGALLLFKCESETVPAEFARNDPYVRNGLVKRWTVRRWTTVVGDSATTPVRPS